jgi:hypothetical protein
MHQKLRHQFIPRPRFCINGLVELFVYLLPFQSCNGFSGVLNLAGIFLENKFALILRFT